MWPGLQKLTMWAQKITDFLYLLYHNLITTYTNTRKPSPLLQSLMSFLLQFTERHTTLGTKDISKNTTQCDLHLDGWFLQAWSHMQMLNKQATLYGSWIIDSIWALSVRSVWTSYESKKCQPHAQTCLHGEPKRCLTTTGVNFRPISSM